MSDELKEFIHERSRRADERLDRLLVELVEIKTRVGRLELSQGQLHLTLAEQSNRIDRAEGRLDRIERRLDLADAQA